MSHTKEPWWNDGAIIKANGAIIAHALDEENASRISACANACAGIDTELLEIIAENNETLSGVISSLEKQRDGLLEELKKAAAYHRSHECYSEATRLDKYIASLKGRTE